MAPTAEITLSEQLKKTPAAMRPTVEAATGTAKAAAPRAEEVTYKIHAPRSKISMWKLFRYSAGCADVLGHRSFANPST